MNPTKSLTLCGINRQNLDMMTLCSWRNKPLCAEWDWNIYLPESLNVGKYSSPIRRIWAMKMQNCACLVMRITKIHLRDRIPPVYLPDLIFARKIPSICVGKYIEKIDSRPLPKIWDGLMVWFHPIPRSFQILFGEIPRSWNICGSLEYGNIYIYNIYIYIPKIDSTGTKKAPTIHPATVTSHHVTSSMMRCFHPVVGCPDVQDAEDEGSGCRSWYV